MKRVTTLLAVTAFGTLAMGQSAATTTASPSSDSNGALIGSLWAGAETLLTSLYPSATDVATLTWPSTVVLGSSTLVASAKSGSTAGSASATPTPTSQLVNNAAQTSTSAPAATSTPASTHTDKRLGIVLGVVIGLVAVLVLAGVLYMLHRRKKHTGSFLRHQPPPDDEEVDSWKSHEPSWQGTQSHIWADKYSPVAGAAGVSPPRSMRPAYMQNSTSYAHNSIHDSSSANSGHNFYTPDESPAELSAVDSRPTTSETVPLNGLSQHEQMGMIPSRRPATPMTHEMMQSPISPIEPAHGHQMHQYDHSNPFASPEDNHFAHQYNAHGYEHVSNPFSSPEDADYHGYNEPPYVPVRSPERRNSPQVHYPSGPELSNFDFGLQRGYGRHSGIQQDGGDGWHPQTTRGGSRHEMS